MDCISDIGESSQRNTVDAVSMMNRLLYCVFCAARVFVFSAEDGFDQVLRHFQRSEAH